MIRLALIFPVLCFVLFGAHLLFHGWGLEIALLPLIPVVLLFVRHRYCASFAACCSFVRALSGSTRQLIWP